MKLQLDDRIQFTKNFPITAFDKDGIPVSISEPHIGLIQELPCNGFPQVLIYHDFGGPEVLGVPMDTIDESAKKLDKSRHNNPQILKALLQAVTGKEPTDKDLVLYNNAYE